MVLSDWEKEFKLCPWCLVKYPSDGKHECDRCDNCGEIVDWHQQRNIHFSRLDNKLLVYSCQKKTEEEKKRIREESPSPQKQIKGCLSCDATKLRNKNLLKSWVSDNESILAMAEIRPNAKGHCVLQNKRHIKDIREMTLKEWNDMLPVLKDTIAKIDKVHKPVGYQIMIPTGKWGAQNHPFFYCRIVPKFKKGYGTIWLKEYFVNSLLLDYKKEEKESFSSSGEEVITRDRVVARLADNEKSQSKGHIIIEPKQSLPNDISSIDTETWAQIGGIVQESFRKLKEKFNPESFSIDIALGKMTYLEETSESNFKLHLIPKYIPSGRVVRNKEFVGTMDNEREAEKLRDPEAYYRKWNKIPRAQLENQLNKREKYYWVGGALLSLLNIFLVVKMIKLRKKIN